MNNNNFTIISFYQFCQLKNIVLLKKFFNEFCSFNKMRGTIIFAPEGVNGTIAGINSAISKFKKELNFKGFKKLEFKYSSHKYMPYNRLKVKIKKEIITFSNLNIDIENSTAKHVNPKKWNNLISNKDTLVLDVRNEFEFQIGTFKNSINPKIKNFS